MKEWEIRAIVDDGTYRYVFRADNMWGALVQFRRTHSFASWFNSIRELKVEQANVIDVEELEEEFYNSTSEIPPA